jgi:ribonuclease T2
MNTMRVLLLLACVALVTDAVRSQVPLQGTLVAAKDCPALQSIKKGTNPGQAAIVAGQSYRLLGKNKYQATHYWIEVPGAQPLQRWVAIACGTADGAQITQPTKQSARVNAPEDRSAKLYVLAMSWQPAFCEGLPDKAECKSQTPTSFEATRFTLHGLWPQPRRAVFCGVDRAMAAADDAHNWAALPEVQLSPATRQALAEVMPGTRSLLDRHEWIKHGTCYPGRNADRYFSDAVRIMAAINASPVQAFVAAHIGQTIRSSDLRAKFDEAFGPGSGDRVRVACKIDGGRQLVSEITVGLRGDIPAGTALKDLIAAASPTDPGCPQGLIDPVGLQ